MEKKTKLQDPKTYWSKLEQETLGCCPMMFSVYQRMIDEKKKKIQ